MVIGNKGGYRWETISHDHGLARAEPSHALEP